jgi:hypothetical protein
MGDRSDRVLTETFRDKRYEEDLTKLYFRVMREIGVARAMPSIEYAKSAYAAAVEFCEAVVFSKEHLARYREKIHPVLEDVELILYGDHRLPSVQAIVLEYGVRLLRIAGKMELEAGNNLIKQLSQAVFLVKQWAYEEGLFLPKPIDRKYGTDAISEVLEQ